MKLIIMVLLLVFSPVIFADEVWFHVNGTSYHPDNRNFNEQNYGVGISWGFDRTNNWTTNYNADVFIDSSSNWTGYIGKEYKKEIGFVSVGANFFLMHRKSVLDNYNIPIFPGVLPTLSFGSEQMKVRMTYIPPVLEKDSQAVALQLQIRVK